MLAPFNLLSNKAWLLARRRAPDGGPTEGIYEHCLDTPGMGMVVRKRSVEAQINPEDRTVEMRHGLWKAGL